MSMAGFVAAAMSSKRLRSALGQCGSVDQSYGACALAARKARPTFWRFSGVSWMKLCSYAVAQSLAISIGRYWRPSDTRDQRSEVGGRRSEVRGQRSEVN